MENIKPLISIIIPNWNGLDLLKICLSSIKKQSLKNFEVLIVDNGSSDKSGKFVKDNYPDFKFVKLEKNFGFAKAVNIGIKNSCGDFLLILNNDTKLDKDCLKYLAQALKNNSSVGMVAAKMMNFSKPWLIDNAGDYIDVSGHLYTLGFGHKDHPKYNQSGFTFLVTGGGSLFRREVFEKIGLFDEDFFMYMEDADLSLRAQIAGFKAWYEPKAIIYHKRMATSSRNMNQAEYLNFRNMIMVIIKNFPISLILRNFNWLKILLVNLNTVIYFIKKGLISKAFAADIYILLHLLKILKKRSKVQELQKVSDNYITENIQDKKIRF